jgi:hypothetical protein
MPRRTFTPEFKCDDCLYTESCMKSSAEAAGLSLLPYLSGTEKETLRRGACRRRDPNWVSTVLQRIPS